METIGKVVSTLNWGYKELLPYSYLFIFITLLATTRTCSNSLLQQPGPKKFKLSKIELLYRAKKF